MCKEQDKDDFLEKIMNQSGCNREIADKSYKESKNRLKPAIDLAKMYHRKQLPTITIYKNGIMVYFNSNETFYSYSEGYSELRSMIKHGEFDKNLLNLDQNFVDVIMIDRENDEYKNFVDFNKKEKEEKQVFPINISFEKYANMKFQILYKTNLTQCLIKESSKMNKVYSYLENKLKSPIKLYHNGVLIDRNDEARKIKDYVLEMVLGINKNN
ncbi:hypothetical protein NUSPORA_00581 [Nucleospora cyclopteri]